MQCMMLQLYGNLFPFIFTKIKFVCFFNCAARVFVPGYESYSMFIFILPSIYSCRLNLLIILNQNLPIGDEIYYDFGKILLSYSVFTRFSMNRVNTLCTC